MIIEELYSLIALRKHSKDKYERLLEFYNKDRNLPIYYIEESLNIIELNKTKEELLK